VIARASAMHWCGAGRCIGAALEEGHGIANSPKAKTHSISRRSMHQLSPICFPWTAPHQYESESVAGHANTIVDLLSY